MSFIQSVFMFPRSLPPSCFLTSALLCYSEAYRYSGSLPAYSPDGKYLATAEDFKLVVRDVDTLQVVQLYSCLDRIKQLEWCCRSEYVLCGLTQRPIVQVIVAGTHIERPVSA